MPTVTKATKFGSVYPYAQVIDEGGELELKCNSYTVPNWTFKGITNRQWNESKNVLKEYIFGNVIYIPKASARNIGQYHCNGTKRNGIIFQAYSMAYVGSKY